MGRLLKGVKHGGWVEVLGALSTGNDWREGGRRVSEKRAI